MWQGGVHGRGVCMAGGYAWQGACVLGGACVVGGMHRRGHEWQGGVRGRRDELQRTVRILLE